MSSVTATCASIMAACSVPCVAAASQRGRSPICSANAARSPSSAGKGRAAALSAPATSTLWGDAPRAAKRSALASSCTRSRSNRRRMSRVGPAMRFRRAKLPSGIRLLTRIIGTPRAFVSTIRRGQKSSSAKAATSGLQWSRKARVAPTVSTGDRTWIARSGSRAAASAVADVAVEVVRTTCASGKSSSARSINGTSARLSPTDRA